MPFPSETTGGERALKSFARRFHRLEVVSITSGGFRVMTISRREWKSHRQKKNINHNIIPTNQRFVISYGKRKQPRVKLFAKATGNTNEYHFDFC